MPLPRGVLVCPPDSFDVVDVKNPFMVGQRGKVNTRLAREQWLEVTRAFGRCGIDVRELPAVTGCEDMVFCANPARSAAKYRERGTRLYAIQDATIACAFAMLAATALGLGTVWVGAFDDVAVQKVLGTRDLLPVAILPIGYAAEEPEPTPRRSLSDLVHE